MAKDKKQIPHLSEKDKERFLGKITTQSPSVCHEWTAGKDRCGYGNFKIGGKSYQSHRVAYFVFKGEQPGDWLVCHSCDNPSCCNPEHLWLGTDKDNALDREVKGRSNPLRGDAHPSRTKPWCVARGESHSSKTRPDRVPRGERNGCSKLTNAIVVEIRRLVGTEGVNHSVLAERFGVAFQTISKVVRRTSWNHV